MANQRISRRGFLKTTTHSTGAAFLSATSYKHVLGANGRIGVGFIGIGLIGKRHLLDFMAQPEVAVAAICEVYPPRLEEGIRTSGGNPKRYKDFRKMLDDKSVDAVVVSTPDHWHALMTILACAAGKDVYVEKPLTHAVCEGRWMLAAARHYRRVVQVGTQQRSGEHYKKCLELIRAGHIGEMRGARMAAYRNIMPGFTGSVGTRPLSEEDWNLWLGPAPYVPFEKQRCIYHFRWFWDYSGGQTTNLLSHDLDIVQWTMDSVPRFISAMGNRYSLQGIGETPDIFEAIFEYPGFLATWSNREICQGRGPESLEFCGTKGTLVIHRGGFEVFADRLLSPESQIPQFTASTRRGTDSAPEHRTQAVKVGGYDQVKDQFQPHVQNFLECVRSRRQPISDLESGHKTATACHLANISMRVARTLRWDSEKQEIIGDPEASKFLTKEYRSPWDKELAGALPKQSHGPVVGAAVPAAMSGRGNVVGSPDLPALTRK